MRLFVHSYEHALSFISMCVYRDMGLGIETQSIVKLVIFSLSDIIRFSF